MRPVHLLVVCLLFYHQQYVLYAASIPNEGEGDGDGDGDEEGTDEGETKFLTSCETPNNDSGGLCMLKEKCVIFTKASFEFLEESECGPKNKKQKKYCCGKFDDFIDKTLPGYCGRQKMFTPTRIFGGTQAQLGEFPWMARLVHERDGQTSFGCSAILIHAEFAVTAAHCTSEMILNALGNATQILLGEHDAETNPDCNSNKICAPQTLSVRIRSIKVYSGYEHASRNHNNDIALVRFRGPIEFSDFVHPICLTEQLHPVSQYYLSGWGKTEDSDTSRIKLKVEVPSIPIDECRAKFHSINIELIAKNQVCAGGEPGKDSCSGDSGGPLMYYHEGKWYAKGIVSFGVGCGRADWPGVYTNLTTYVPWIRKQIQGRLERKHPKL